VYFEFPSAKIAANPYNPQLQYLAFKWDVFDCDKSVVTRYSWYPSLSVSEIRERIFQIYSEGDSDTSFQNVNEVLDLAASRVPAEKLQYLEVREEETGRKSFDLNLYDARFQLKDIYPILTRMRKRYSISPGDFQALYDQIKNKVAGHLAGGVHRNGKDFFNVYYGGIPEMNRQISQTSLSKSVDGATRASDLFEYATDRDPHFNYSLWKYPSAAPPRDKFRAVNLLYHSFELGGMSEQGYGLVETIRHAIGSFQTVFGIKLCDNRLGWEFYFYDYRRLQRKVSISKVLSAIKPIAACSIQPNENLPYFMFSLDIDDALVTGARDIELVHMYIGNPGSTVSSGISYALQSDNSTMENFYFFLMRRRNWRKRQTRFSARPISILPRFISTGSCGLSCAIAEPFA
jgi:hypothetical protein